MILIKVLLFIVFGIICPYCIGALVTFLLNYKKDSVALNFVYGYILCFAVFYLLVMPCFLFHASLTLLTVLYAILTLLATIVSVLVNEQRLITPFLDYFIHVADSRNILMLVALIIISIQTIYVTAAQHIDEDDAFYIATAETAVSTDSIMRYDAYTGEEYTYVPSRYVLSPFPIYHAVMGRLTGFKPVEYAHTCFPLVMLPLCYMVYYLISGLLFKKSETKKAFFLLLLSFVMFYSGSTVYTQGTFLFLRIWQGKAVLAAIIIPLILYTGMTIYRKPSKWKVLVLFAESLAACFVSSMGIMLGAICIALLAIINFITYRTISVSLYILLCCVPNILFSVIYIVIR